MQYDIAIIGLGPAGATLARLLDKGCRVLALDKKGRTDKPDGFHKPCGGLLAPDAQKALSRYNLTLPLGVLVDPQIFSVRTIDVPSGRIRHYQRFYMNLDRHKFDLWLKSLIPSSVEVRDNACCTHITRTAQGFRIAWTEDGRSREATARYVVGADGAGSRVRRELFPQAHMRSYLSIQQWFPDRHATPFYSCVFDPAATDCYAWGLSKGEHFIFGGAFAAQGGRESFEGLKARLVPYGFHFGRPVKTEACLVLRPTGPSSFCCGGEGAFLVGEAAGMISPSSLEGMSYAFNSAHALAQVLNRGEGDPAGGYRRATRGIRLKLLAKCAKSPFLYHPTLRGWVMASGLQSIPVERDGDF